MTTTPRTRTTGLVLVGALALTTVLSVTSVGPAVGAPTTTATASATSPAGARGLVVKIRSGHALSEVTNAYPVTSDSTLLASKGIFLLRAKDATTQNDVTKLKALASSIAQSTAITYVEPNWTATLKSSRYQSWPEGSPSAPTTDSGAWRSQPAFTPLDLSTTHRYSTGVAIKVAVLDTGIDPSHPALTGRLISADDDIDDDTTPTDTKMGVDTNGNGIVDDAYGHGTFVAGTLALVAPDARIMPYRVLDSDGTGNVFVIAQAIMDAADAGAKVINLSFGTDQPVDSKVLVEAITTVQQRGVIVVAAAGNSGSTTAQYPAADAGVLSVTATSNGALTSWANRGSSWVDVAAPGSAIVGPFPGGTYAHWSGTSMAAPVVAGQIALLRSRYPTATAAQIVASVGATSTSLSDTAMGSVNLLASVQRKPS